MNRDDYITLFGGIFVVILVVGMFLLLQSCISIQIVECDATPENCTVEAVSIDTVTDVQPKKEEVK